MEGCFLLGVYIKKKKLASWFVSTFEVRYSCSSNMNAKPLLEENCICHLEINIIFLVCSAGMCHRVSLQEKLINWQILYLGQQKEPKRAHDCRAEQTCKINTIFVFL